MEMKKINYLNDMNGEKFIQVLKESVLLCMWRGIQIGEREALQATSNIFEVL